MLVPTALGVRTVMVFGLAAQNQNAVAVVALDEIPSARNRNRSRNGLVDKFNTSTTPGDWPATSAPGTAAKPVALSGAITTLSLKPGSVTVSVVPPEFWRRSGTHY